MFAEYKEPPLYAEDICVWFKTNNAASENAYKILNEEGNIVLQRTNMANNTLYKDTLHLSSGCYVFEVTDSDKDGLYFFGFNNESGGYIYFKKLNGNMVKNFKTNFGTNITHHFRVGNTQDIHEYSDRIKVNIFPNPSQDVFNIELGGFKRKVVLEIYTFIGEVIYSKEINNIYSFEKIKVNLSNYPDGIYFIKILSDKDSIVKKIVKY